ncbi:sigma-70 family RNA polymerase sigma factor [Nonomuraea sp. SMC257]|uniref:Sigma-70 family RNA polymerase sigma factor n=1 Tax=Nonomuraea montanisoli TaxID=2741721 RepID=A0A7Y6LZU9_9ACTN|nr:sigma-70 family RNA polymerase sigma factor [Nonomuraea montanisoli]NUW29838.1 sigma-70 family RNA polymerase sigma factor [Nonomuraea montanisoli]
MRDDPIVIALVTRARKGDQGAWNELVERYLPLVWSICRRYRLSRPDADDVAQTVCLRLVEHLAVLRVPAALPGWLAVTTQRECVRLLRAVRRREVTEQPMNDDLADDDEATAMIEQELERAERHAALRAAFAQLPAMCRELLTLLMRDPPLPYAEIGRRLGTPVGGIGPRRARCLDRLRQSPYLHDHLGPEGGGHV